MLSDILPTGFECGVLNGKVAPGSTVAIVGAGPIGLAALLTAQFYSPAEIIMIDLDDNRLGLARQFGATQTINSADGKAAQTVKATGGRGVDTAIEAVGVPATFLLCQQLVDRAASSPTSGSWRQSGTASRTALVTKYRDHDPTGRYRHDGDAVENRAIEEDPDPARDHTSVHLGRRSSTLTRHTFLARTLRRRAR